MKRGFFVLICLLAVFAGCTRDDICTDASPKTPLLIIRFFDNLNPAVLKPVQGLVIFPEGGDIALFDPATTDSIAIPLKTFQDMTAYDFVKNAGTNTSDESSIEFLYSREDEFINRACAFRTIYKNLTTGLIPSGWIQNVQVQTDSITPRNQNEAHLYIYH
jgi:hypothetical protein